MILSAWKGKNDCQVKTGVANKNVFKQTGEAGEFKGLIEECHENLSFLLDPFVDTLSKKTYLSCVQMAKIFFSKFSIKLSTSENNIFKGTIEEILSEIISLQKFLASIKKWIE